MTPVLFLIFGPPVEEQQQSLELLSGPGLYIHMYKYILGSPSLFGLGELLGAIFACEVRYVARSATTRSVVFLAFATVESVHIFGYLIALLG